MTFTPMLKPSRRRSVSLAGTAIVLMSLCRLDTIRLQILNHSISWSYLYIMYGMIFGIFQDLSLLLQFYIGFRLCRRMSSACLLLLLYSLPIILDSSLQHWGYPRLAYSDLKTVFWNFSQFRSSFEQVVYDVSSAVVIMLYITAVITISRYSLDFMQIRVSKLRQCGLVLVSMISTNFILFIHLNQSPQTAYVFDNAVLSLQIGLLMDLCLNTFLSSTPSTFTPISYSMISSIIGENEHYSLLSSQDHPLWRLTSGYHGPVRFNLSSSSNQPHPYNVLVLNMESWSHHMMGCLNNQTHNESLTPEFDRLAEQGILFTSHYSPSSQTSRTLLTHLFGVKPKFDHDAALATQSRSLCVYGLADILKERGYRNEFLSGTDLNWHDWKWFLTHHSFDQCHDKRSMINRLQQLGIAENQYEQQSWGLHDQQAAIVLQDRLQQLHNASTPYFVDFYSVSSHSPFIVPSNSLSDDDWAHPAVVNSNGRTSANYKTSIIYSDRVLGQLIRSLRSKGILKHTITIIQGDHGRGKDFRLGSNPELHMVDLLDDFQRVPLLILLPSADEHMHRSMKITQVSSQYDIMATIMDMLGIKSFKQHGIGQSLMRQPTGNRTIFIDNPINGFKLFAAVTDLFKYVFHSVDKKVCIYNRLLDKDELHPDCIAFAELDSSYRHYLLKGLKQNADALQNLFEQSYSHNEFFPCKIHHDNNT